MLTNRTSYCYIEDIVILQILQYITSTLSLEHVKQNHCTVVTAKAKGNSLLLNIWDDDISMYAIDVSSFSQWLGV